MTTEEGCSMFQLPHGIVYNTQLKGVFFLRFAVIIWPFNVSGRVLQVPAGHKDDREGGDGRMPDLL